MIDKTQFTNEDKEVIIAQALNTDEGRVALAQAMVEPIRPFVGVPGSRSQACSWWTSFRKVLWLATSATLLQSHTSFRGRGAVSRPDPGR